MPFAGRLGTAFGKKKEKHKKKKKNNKKDKNNRIRIRIMITVIRRRNSEAARLGSTWCTLLSYSHFVREKSCRAFLFSSCQKGVAC